MMKLEGYIYNSANCKQYLLWKEQIESIINSLSIKKYNDKIKLIEQLCKGNLKNKLVKAMAKTKGSGVIRPKPPRKAKARRATGRMP